MSMSLHDILAKTVDIVRPPERLTVAEAAARYRKVYNPGSYVGDWRNDLTPYMIEVQEILSSLEYTGLVFMGPARSGKSDLFFNWLIHTQVCDPADMMMIHMTQATARDWSQIDLAKVIRHNKELEVRLAPGARSRNVHDIHFDNGTHLLVKWPTITELSGKTMMRLWLADYDRMPQDVDGEGPPFDLARKRAGTFGRFGMTVAESSPGFVVTDTRHVPKTRHEAPITSMEDQPGGIAALYNRGDRRRWYWTCDDCGVRWEPSFIQMRYPETDDISEAAALAEMECPHCGFRIKHDPSGQRPGKYQMNLGGVWVRDRTAAGDFVKSNIASFWLKGPAAGLTNWETIVADYLTAKREYDDTGAEESLKSVTGLSLGECYVPKQIQSDRLPEELMARAEARDVGVVPLDCRFLVAAIDVQKNYFDVQVHGTRSNGDVDIVDRFQIRKSERLDADGERYWVSPGSHPEDWRLLVERVILKRYPLADGSGREMAIRLVICDWAGEAGVTTQALNFWRWLRDGPPADAKSTDGWEPGMGARFLLQRGSKRRDIPFVKTDYPNAHRKDRHSGARGDVPVLVVNSNVMKDALDKKLARTAPGGRVNFPVGLPNNFYQQLCVETRNPRGEWENPRNSRNETWDLLVMYLAACLTPRVNLENINWKSPPSWAAEWSGNSLVSKPGEDAAKDSEEEDAAAKLTRLARQLA